MNAGEVFMIVPGAHEVLKKGRCYYAPVCPEARVRMCCTLLVHWTCGEVCWGLLGNAQGVTDIVQFGFSGQGSM